MPTTGVIDDSVRGATVAKQILAEYPDAGDRKEFVEDELSSLGKERAREMTEGVSESYHRAFESELRKAVR